MASLSASAFAIVIHYLLRISIFMEQPIYTCSVAPNLASWIYLASTFLIMLDTTIYPTRYRNIPRFCQFFVESIICLILTELSTIVIWCTFEKTFHRLLKCILVENTSNMYYDMGGDSLVGALLTLISIFVFYNASIATNYYDDVKKLTLKTFKMIVGKVKSIWGSFPTKEKYMESEFDCNFEKPKRRVTFKNFNIESEESSSDDNGDISNSKTQTHLSYPKSTIKQLSSKKRKC